MARSDWSGFKNKIKMEKYAQIIFPLVIIGFMWVFIVWPQYKILKKQKQFQENLQKGMIVQLKCGIIGRIEDIFLTTITILISPNVLVEVNKSFVEKEVEKSFE